MNYSDDLIPIPMKSGIFRYSEQGHGELYPACEKCMNLRSTQGITAALVDRIQVRLIRNELHFDHVLEASGWQELVKRTLLETQNAYGFAEASERW